MSPAETKPAPLLNRLIAPRSVALIGAGAWTDAVAAGCAAIGFSGQVWRVHPHRPSTAAMRYYRSVLELPGAPDAAFVAVPNSEAGAVAAALAKRGAGGFVCFTAGFSETGTEAGERLAKDLSRAAGALPFFGPNCYGFVNFLDRCALWPDQVVGPRLERGVALICQSGTIALTLMFNGRSLPIGQVFTVGNQTRLAVEDLIEFLCDDPRISAFGLYIEGIKNTERFARAADKARVAGKPIAVIKAGRTEAAVNTARSHTGALAGSDGVFEAFCRQAGLARCDTLSTLCETLKLFHSGGPLGGGKILIMGPSGGDMAMTADVARGLALDFAPVPADKSVALRGLLTDRVAIANPFDINTYLWFDPRALRRVFKEVLSSGYDAVGFMLDSPPENAADTAAFDAVIDVFIDAARDRPANTAPTRAALIASLPETISTRIRQDCLDNGVAPLQGQREALEALALAGAVGAAWRSNPVPQLQAPSPPAATSRSTRTLTEHEGKAALAEFGVRIPRGMVGSPGAAADAAVTLGFPVVIKALGAHLEHKTEVGGVALNVRTVADAIAAGERLRRLSDTLLIEEMIGGGVAEILVGITCDPQFGQVLVLGAGGVLAELLGDTTSLLPPWNRTAVHAALRRLRVAKLLDGYRGKPAADVEALVAIILGVARFASAHLDSLIELDVNPVVVRPLGKGAVAVDALIRLHKLD
ncbi:MAG: acetate--CoA ligase family protein [Steroidobacteraceae bacterium]|jgi:acetyl-CoA synthetase